MSLVHCVLKWLIIGPNDAFCIQATTCIQFFFLLICFKRAGHAVPLRLKGSDTHAHTQAHTNIHLRLIKCMMTPVVISLCISYERKSENIQLVIRKLCPGKMSSTFSFLKRNSASSPVHFYSVKFTSI